MTIHVRKRQKMKPEAKTEEDTRKNASNRHTEDKAQKSTQKSTKYLRLLEELMHVAELHHTPMPGQVHTVMLDTAREPPYLDINNTDSYKWMDHALDIYTDNATLRTIGRLRE